MTTIKTIIQHKWGMMGSTWTDVILEWGEKTKKLSTAWYGRSSEKDIAMIRYIEKICPDYSTSGTYNVPVSLFFTRLVFGDLPRGRRFSSNIRHINLSGETVCLTEEESGVLSFINNGGKVVSKMGFFDVYRTTVLQDLIISTDFYSREKIGVAVFSDSEYEEGRGCGGTEVSFRLVVAKNGRIGRWEGKWRDRHDAGKDNQSNYMGKVISVSYSPKRDEVFVATKNGSQFVKLGK